MLTDIRQKSQIDFWIRHIRRSKNEVRRIVSVLKHVDGLVIERATTVLAGHLMRLIHEKIVNLNIGFSNKQIQKSFRRQNKDEVVVSLEGNVACSIDDLVVFLLQKIL